jgi:hypothetical protein
MTTERSLTHHGTELAEKPYEGTVTTTSLLSHTNAPSLSHSVEPVTQNSDTSTVDAHPGTLPSDIPPGDSESQIKTLTSITTAVSSQEQPLTVGQASDQSQTQTTMMPLMARRPHTHMGLAPPSPARSSIDMGSRHARIDDLIASKTLYNFEGKPFLPVDVIESLRDRTKIEDELRAARLNDSAGTLTRYILETPAINIFLTLVACDLTYYSTHFQSIMLSDEALPLNNSSDQLPSRWRARDRFEFSSKQWLFLAPIFTNDEFVHILDRKCPIPITKVNHTIQPRTGLSGSVREIELHSAHQKVFQSVRPPLLFPL